MKVIRGAMLFLDLTSFFISYLLVLEMLISDHILPVFLIVSPNRTIRSGFGNYPPKTCGTTQPVLHFDHFQTSWCLPCPAKVKEQQGEKVPVCSLYPRPLHHQGLRFSALGSPWPWGTGPAFPGSGEKLEDPRKRKKKILVSSFFEQMETQRYGRKKGWGSGMGWSSRGQKEIHGAGGVLEVTFQGGVF